MPPRIPFSILPISAHALTWTWALAFASSGCLAPDEARQVDRERAAVTATDGDESAGPLARVAFPPQQSATNDATIRVRGTGRANADIVSIEANGVPVQTSDGFATWTVEVPLELGVNQVEVLVTTQQNGKTRTRKVAELSVGRETDLTWPTSLFVDAEGNRALVTDFNARALYSVDLETGVSRVISSAERGTGPALLSPRAVAHDAVHDRALIVDQEHLGLLAVDLETGDRTLLTGIGAGTGPEFVLPFRIAVDAEQGRAFVTDPSVGAVFAVELDSGARTVFSAAGAGPALGAPVGVALDAPAQRLLVTDWTLEAVLSVDLANGDRAIVSDNSYCPWCLSRLTDIVVDRTNNRALVLDDQWLYHVMSMDLDSGAMDSVGQGFIGYGPLYGSVQALALDEAHDRILLASPEIQSIMALYPAPPDVDMSRSVTIYLTRLPVGAGQRPVHASNGMVWNPRKWLIYEAAQRALLWVDAVTGDRRVATELSPEIALSAGLERDGEDRVIVGERQGNCEVIYSFDLGSGQGTPIAGGDSPGPCIEDMEDLVSDPTRNRLLVLIEEQGLYAIDRETGARTQISGEHVGSGTGFGESIMLELDPARDRVLVTDEGVDGLLSVDLSTGDREPIFEDVRVPPAPDDDSSSEEPGTVDLELIAIDVARDQVVAVDRQKGLIFELDLATDTYRLVSGSYKGRGPQLRYVQSVFLDTERDLIIVHSMQLGGLVAVDRVTGDRVIASR